MSSTFLNDAYQNELKKDHENNNNGNELSGVKNPDSKTPSSASVGGSRPKEEAELLEEDEKEENDIEMLLKEALTLDVKILGKMERALKRYRKSENLNVRNFGRGAKQVLELVRNREAVARNKFRQERRWAEKQIHLLIILCIQVMIVLFIGSMLHFDYFL